MGFVDERRVPGLPRGYTTHMDSGLIIPGGDETPVPVYFRLDRNGQSGTVAAKQVRDFSTLLRLFDGDDTVILQNVRGTWKARVHILEPDTLDPRLASLRFTVQERIEG